MSPSTINRSPSEPATALGDAIAQATACPVEVWERLDDRRWRRIPRGLAASDAAESGHGAPQPGLVELLERAYETNSVCRDAIANNSARIAVPMPSCGREAVEIAEIHVPRSRAGDVERIVALTLQTARHEFEAQALRDENLAFAQQVTDDFEELTFLRMIAADLAITDASLSVGDIVGQAAGPLRLMIGAKALYHVCKGDGGDLVVSEACLADDLDDPSWDEELILRTADACRRRTRSGPYICNDMRREFPEAHAAGVNQLLIVPICTAQRRFGWFLALNRTIAGREWPPSPLLQLGQDEFGTWEASLSSTAASLIASQASNLDLLREKERLLINTVRALVSAFDAKDNYTRGHSERVARFSRRIALAMGHSVAAADRLHLAGLLHDVGKIGVRDATLRKPDRLTAEEFAEMTQHPDEGWAILRDLPQLEYVLPAVLHHHEQFNGSGYPDRLVGEEIPLDARIMAVADAFDAMTSDRAYRTSMGTEKALEILRRGAGTQWDPRVVEALENNLDEILAIRTAYQPVERSTRSAPALIPHCRS